jgi:DNA-3-methyladenine glycosylase II
MTAPMPTFETAVPSRVIAVRGRFDLARSARFLAGFTPAGRPGADGEPSVLRLAFPVDGTETHAGALIRQRSPGSVVVDIYGPPELADTVAVQVRRVLSLDVDGGGFTDVGARDPVVAQFQAARPGLRPVLFGSPYEAACWAVLSQRVAMVQAARVRKRITEELGGEVDVGGVVVPAFPAPAELAALEPGRGLPELKVERLRAVAEAARDGALDAAELRALPVEEALCRLELLPGIGPFSAELILVRGAGHPDVFPSTEGRLHEAMRKAYHLPDADPAELAEIAEQWRPFRSWVAFLLRSQQEVAAKGKGGEACR